MDGWGVTEGRIARCGDPGTSERALRSLGVLPPVPRVLRVSGVRLRKPRFRVVEQVVLTVVRVRWQDGVVVLTMSGELDVFTADHLDRKFAALAAAGHSRIALDVAGLSFCDACGLRVLIRASDRAEAGTAGCAWWRWCPGCAGWW